MTPPKAVGLFSGGLDSLLAVHMLREQNINVQAVTFTSPFFTSEKAAASAKTCQIPLQTVDMTSALAALIKNPPHGFGKGANPCIDCHALMFRMAGQVMEDTRADFLFSGEVLGQRPMSQNSNSLDIVARGSGYAERILRPLSARKLPPTPMEESGIVDRSQLGDISGRNRKTQILLAEKYGIREYPGPAGGCMLTHREFGKKVFDLIQNGNYTHQDMERLRYGRHFRIGPGVKLVIGRNEQENSALEKLRGTDLVLYFDKIPGPVCLLSTPHDFEALEKSFKLAVFYSDSVIGEKVAVSVSQYGKRERRVFVTARDCRNLRQAHLIQ